MVSIRVNVYGVMIAGGKMARRADVHQASKFCRYAQLKRAAPEVGIARIGTEHLYR